MAVSADGSTIVGYKSTYDLSAKLSGREAFRWIVGQGFVNLESPPETTQTQAYDVSGDGLVVVGAYKEVGRPSAQYVPCVWAADGSVISLGARRLHQFWRGYNVSHDGSIIAVRGALATPGGYQRREAWLWTEDADYVYVGEMYLNDMNSDGSVLVGFTTGPLREYRWTAETGMEAHWRTGDGLTVSEDGVLIFGVSKDGIARIWDRANGDRDLRSVLISEFDLADELQGWTVSLYCPSTSLDNRIIVGRGTNPNGEKKPWMAILDPPLQAGDADQDRDFDQLDLVQVQVAGKYLTGEPATWGEGDWNGAPAVFSAKPPEGDGVFNQLDIVAAQQAGLYLTGSYAAARRGDSSRESQVSVGYDAND